MHRVLERLDGAASTLVPLLYLGGLVAGTVAYFGAGLSLSLVVVAIGLGTASELHAFLQLRRARVTYGEYRRLRVLGGDAGDALASFRVNLAVLCGLVAFQCFTAVGFAAETWHPAAGFLPAWVQILLRGLVVPLLFLAAGFLVPVRQSPADVLTRASDEILHSAVRGNVRHWRRRIRRAHRRGADLSPLMVALLDEAGETAAARRTTLIADTLAQAEREMGPGWLGRAFHRGARVSPLDAVLPAVLPEAAWRPLPPPPTGPGTPAAGGRANTRAGAGEGAGLALVSPDGRGGIRRANAARLARIERRRAEREARVAGWLTDDPALAKREVARRLRVSESHASDLVNTVRERLRAQGDQRVAQ